MNYQTKSEDTLTPQELAMRAAEAEHIAAGLIQTHGKQPLFLKLIAAHLQKWAREQYESR